MNTATSTPPPDDRDDAASQATRAEQLAATLATVVGMDGFWKVVPAPSVVTLTHGWDDGSVDTLVIAGPRAAYAFRENPGGREVWRTEGRAEQVEMAVRKLPAPTEPNAPDGSSHTPGPNGTWT